MRKPTLFVFATLISLCVSAQDNMEAFRHFSVGAEVGLHGFGLELAVPVQKHLVLKAGYNWAPAGDLSEPTLSLTPRISDNFRIITQPSMSLSTGSVMRL